MYCCWSPCGEVPVRVADFIVDPDIVLGWGIESPVTEKMGTMSQTAQELSDAPGRKAHKGYKTSTLPLEYKQNYRKEQKSISKQTTNQRHSKTLLTSYYTHYFGNIVDGTRPSILSKRAFAATIQAI